MWTVGQSTCLLSVPVFSCLPKLPSGAAGYLTHLQFPRIHNTHLAGCVWCVCLPVLCAYVVLVFFLAYSSSDHHPSLLTSIIILAPSILSLPNQHHFRCSESQANTRLSLHPSHHHGSLNTTASLSPELLLLLLLTSTTTHYFYSFLSPNSAFACDS